VSYTADRCALVSVRQSGRDGTALLSVALYSAAAAADDNYIQFSAGGDLSQQQQQQQQQLMCCRLEHRYCTLSSTR